MADNSRRGWCQFGLRDLLGVLLVVGVGFGGYRQGFFAGHASGLIEGANQRRVVGTPYAKAYVVSDLVTPPVEIGNAAANADRLIRSLTDTILPNTWSKAGGEAAISFYDEKSMLVVNHDQDAHDRIAEYLNQLRHQTNR